MKVLVIGSGGREHALIWKLIASGSVDKVYCLPGNGGISQIAECYPIAADSISEQVRFALKMAIDLVVVGPEIPLIHGIVDKLAEAGIPAFGPSALAARLEGSKAFMKSFCTENHIPTAGYDLCGSWQSAMESVARRAGRCAVKADGLAAGKGVIVTKTMDDAQKAIRQIMIDRVYGAAGDLVVVEDLLVGEEVSVMAVCDGKTARLLIPCQDHKAAFDGDAGPNTGGMGAYCPANVLTSAMESRITDRIIRPAIDGMARIGAPFKGILYAGVMIVENEPLLLEFNVRFGDPETQPVMLKLKSDLLGIMEAVVTGRLDHWDEIKWNEGVSMCVVLASGGYPGDYRKGFPIEGLNEQIPRDDTVVFHAGTTLVKGRFFTGGGRVLGVTGIGKTVAEAKKTVYQRIQSIRFDHMHYRSDIGWRALR
jgi:phosphoribosylamine---glycine ligase